MIKKYDIKTPEAKIDYCYELLCGKSFPDSMQLELEQRRSEYVAIKSSYGIEANARIERLYNDCLLLSVKRLQENVLIRGNACDQTSHVIKNILSLLGGTTISRLCGITPFPVAAMHGGTQGCVERDPYLCGGSRRQELKKDFVVDQAKTSRHLDARDFSQKYLKIKSNKKDQSNA